MKKIILATHNKGKVAELAGLLKEIPGNSNEACEVLSLADFPEIGDIPETGSTFQENAFIKARTVAKKTGLLAVADDSGLMVEALNNRPGVYSARFGDDLKLLPNETKDQRNIRKLLGELSGLAKENPDDKKFPAKFFTAIACVAPNGAALQTQGEWAGQIIQEKRGNNGFGYDPVFLDNELNKTAAELTSLQKNERSHRGKALKELLKCLPDFLARNC